MRTLLPFLNPYRKECVLAPLFKLLEAVLELFVPLIMAAIIDNGIQARDTGYVLRMGLGLVGLGLLGLVSSVTAQFFAAKAAVGFAAKLKSALFRHIQGLSYTELDTLGTATLINRMTTDMNQVQTGVNMTLRLLLRSPFVVLGAMVITRGVLFNAREPLVFFCSSTKLPPVSNTQYQHFRKISISKRNKNQGENMTSAPVSTRSRAAILPASFRLTRPAL